MKPPYAVFFYSTGCVEKDGNSLTQEEIYQAPKSGKF